MKSKSSIYKFLNSISAVIGCIAVAVFVFVVGFVGSNVYADTVSDNLDSNIGSFVDEDISSNVFGISNVDKDNFYKPVQYSSPVFAAASSDVSATENIVENLSEDIVLSKDDVADTIRGKLVCRSGEFTLNYVSDDSSVNPYVFSDEVFKHTDNPKEGDYLKVHTSYGYNRSYYQLDDGLWFNTCTITPHYYGFDTADEACAAEEQVDVRVIEILNSLNISTLSEYDRIKAIYGWIINNIEYDYENQSSKLAATAYVGLIEGKCACAGYSVICYRLMLEAGIDCRYITGNTSTGWHAWNIVRVDDKYYNLDATWDSSRIEYGYTEFFLVSDDDCYDHHRDEEYATEAWYTAYPMCSKSYQLVSSKFSDVEQGEWYTDAVQWAYDNDIMTGYGPDYTIFGVRDTITRADFVTMLWRYLEPEAYATYDEATSVNTTGLSDVEDGTYWTGAANWAVANGIVTGYQVSDGSYIFAPYDPVTFDQLVTILARYNLGFAGAETYPTSVLDEPRFTDGNEVEAWATGSMSWAIDNGIVTGNANANGTYTIAPLDDVARERACTVLWRCIGKGII